METVLRNYPMRLSGIPGSLFYAFPPSISDFSPEE